MKPTGAGRRRPNPGRGERVGHPGRAPTAPAPPALTSEDAGAELFYFFLFLFFFSPSIPNQPIWGNEGVLNFCCFFFFLNIWKFLHPIQSEKKEKKKALTRQNPRNPSSILAALLGGDPCAQEGLYEQPRARSAHVLGPRTLGHSAGALPQSQVRGCGMLPCIPPMGLCRRNAKP